MIINILLYVFMPVSIVLAFMWAPSAEILGHASRIIYFHVPVAWVSVIAFFVSGICSVLYLLDSGKKFEMLEVKSYNSAVIGITFTLLTVITGSMWAKISWGIWWNWDPRETSIVVLLLIYIAYLSLHSALGDNGNRGRISSVYLILAMITVPFLIFIIPRIYLSLHPDPIINPDKKIFLDTRMRLVLLFSVVSFTMLYFKLLIQRNRISAIERRIEEKYEE